MAKDKLGHGSNKRNAGSTNGEGSNHPNHPGNSMHMGGSMSEHDVTASYGPSPIKH